MSNSNATPVREVMTPSPVVIDGLATIREAMDLMRERGVSSVVVNRRHDEDEYGLVVVQDIAVNIIAADRSPERTNVYEIMSKPVLSLPAEMSTRYAVRLLSRFGLSRALVTENRHLIGIVTLRDMVFRYLP